MRGAARFPACGGDAAGQPAATDIHLVVRVAADSLRSHPAHVALTVESALAAFDPAGFDVLEVFAGGHELPAVALRAVEAVPDPVRADPPARRPSPPPERATPATPLARVTPIAVRFPFEEPR